MSELRVVTGGSKDDLWISNTPLGASNRAIGASLWGLAETLLKVSTTGALEPWLALEVRNIDPLTWHAVLRPNARFWDGTPVDAAAVAASLRETLEVQRDGALLLGPEVHLRAIDQQTLELRTPEPLGHLAHALTHPQFAIHRARGTIMTGPYRPVEFEDDRQLRLERFPEHWSGRPPLERISVTVEPDLEARIAALTSGQVDVIYGFPPESAGRLADFGSDYDVCSTPTVRLVFVQLNCAKPPFDDRDLREATVLAIDGAGLVRDVLKSHGAPAHSFIPEYMADDEWPMQSSDPARAAQLLDARGWHSGADGVRVKDGERLAFSLLTPSGPVLAVTPLAHGVARQLRELGYDVTVQPEDMSEFHRKTGAREFSAAMAASITLLTGDPWFLMRVRLASDGRANPGTYASERFDRVLGRMTGVAEPQARRASWRELQGILAEDVPRILLVFLPNIVVSRRGSLRNLVAQPNNEYFIDTNLTLNDGDLHD